MARGHGTWAWHVGMARGHDTWAWHVGMAHGPVEEALVHGLRSMDFGFGPGKGAMASWKLSPASTRQSTNADALAASRKISLVARACDSNRSSGVFPRRAACSGGDRAVRRQAWARSFCRPPHYSPCRTLHVQRCLCVPLATSRRRAQARGMHGWARQTGQWASSPQHTARACNHLDHGGGGLKWG